jgi:hypothetical protein
MELGAVLGVLRVAGQHEEIPGVAVRRMVGVLARTARRNKFDDVTVVVLGPCVGRIELVAVVFCSWS